MAIILATLASLLLCCRPQVRRKIQESWMAPNEFGHDLRAARQSGAPGDEFQETSLQSDLKACDFGEHNNDLDPVESCQV